MHRPEAIDVEPDSKTLLFITHSPASLLVLP